MLLPWRKAMEEAGGALSQTSERIAQITEDVLASGFVPHRDSDAKKWNQPMGTKEQTSSW